MSFNGSGTFVINSAGQPVVANTVISATVFNALTSDLATGLSTCITKDGQTTITANIPFGSNKITGLGAGTVATDAANLGQVQSTAAKLITVTGTDTITGTMSPVLTAYAAGQLFYFISNGTNTGAITINIDGLGAKAITRDGSTALIAGDVVSGEIVVICYDGTRFQMINAANSFGNTTINGTLTVTGDTALQANVSVTSALTVNGTFGVTGAATLGSTLSVAGKSDLPTVSTASMNAAVAVVTTGTVTNLTSTSASIASMNAGVALLTTATVTTLTASGASIASANIGNLQFTAASIASINAGVAVITNLTATGASIASANVGTAVITTGTVTNLTSTSASVASANAGVALITTGTVTNLISTSASIASANVGTAVITTGTLTNLTATSASVASANVGVALITTGTITSLTATGASVASANVGTAVVTGLTVTNASIASLNAGTATITTGNLTFSGTAQRITGDMSNATIANRLAFQNSVSNQQTAVAALPNGTSTQSQFMAFGANDGVNTNVGVLINTGSEVGIRSNITGTGTYVPLTFNTGGSERVRIDTSGNMGIGLSSLTIPLQIGKGGGGNPATSGTTQTYGIARIGSSGAAALDVGTYAAGQVWMQGVNVTNLATNYDLVLQPNGGNLGIGTASPNKSSSSTALTVNTGTAGNFSAVEWASGDTLNYHINANNSAIYHVAAGTRPWIVYTNGTERMRIDGSTGNVGIGGTANAAAKVNVLGTLPTSSNSTQGFRMSGEIPSGTTTVARSYLSFPATAAASFTLTDLYHFEASQGTFGAGSTVTNQYGFVVASSLTGATNNYGFYGNIASGTNRYNVYMAGTADNYFAGNVGIGTASPTQKLDVFGADNANLIMSRNSNGTSSMRIQSNAAGSYIVSAGAIPLLIDVNGAERARLTSGGDFLVNATSSNGRFCVETSSAQTTAFFGDLNASTTQNVISAYTSRAADSAFNFLKALSNGGSDTEFLLRGDGNGYADGTWNNNGADYAEFFESATGAALTVGATVVLDGNKVREATASDPVSSIIGVVRPKEPGKASMMVGNTAWNKWANKYLTDDFDRYIMEDHDVVEWTDADGKQHSYESHNIPADVTVPSDAVVKTHDDKGNKFQHYKLNPAYNPDSEYTPREKRDEWIIVGLVGQVKVLKGKPVNDRWIKMRDVSAAVEEWMIR